MKKNNNVVFIGNFGNGSNINGSQVKKTISVYNYLISKNIRVAKVNSEKFKTPSLPIVLMHLVYRLLFSDHVIVSLNKNGIKFGNFILLKIITKLNKRRLLFITIGGWLPDFLNENKSSIQLFMKFSKIYVQVDKIKTKLERIGFKNIRNIGNFRDYSPNLLAYHKKKIQSINYFNKTKIKLVFCAFIRKEKGLDLIIEAIRTFNENNDKQIFTLDIIGPIEKKYKKEFESLINDNAQFCNYVGSIFNQESIYEQLNKYDLLAFPTYYEGEGFPTIIVESFISGLPVIASDWKYNNEIIEDGVNGLIFRTKDVEHIVSKLEWLYTNKTKIKTMRLTCLKEAIKFHPEKVLNTIISDLNSE